MTNPSVSTALDLDAITATRWADPDAFPEAEFAKAEAFWLARREHDARLGEVFDRATALVREWTGCEPRDVGSFGLRLNLESSDLDLGIGYPAEDRQALIAALAPHTSFKGERHTRFSTTRLVFSFTVDDVEIDLSALTVEDYAVAGRMLDEIATTMTEHERIAHTWVKHLLRAQGRMEDYASWKLVTYARFCPEFNWVPIPETV
ncbi:hypothetical protein [Actinosynnema mirum]|uniref:Polymerase nucleotidyl transferase domain-containing protein n=1 Tax=Actinosynnema mirum (strain ATCC 29888 / DSM 43827 / JCM 3225 / NBRC 14064 / NCIMB 13271 / NRRL B-12336 / IMRU 3971 / 101) TaxID=446462 RepID=C6WBX0_ACTMD|nr:hypothetical protein [Actinosynnema mirum]ACU37537.1 hypothetical protein Amir_3652 [Actinosynnema mirum DSM 43827]